MRKLLVLAVMTFCISLTAAADDLVVTAEPSAPPSEQISLPSRVNNPTYQLGLGFQYQHFHVYGLSFPTYGYNIDINRDLNGWGSLEGMVAFGFGHGGGRFNPDAKSLFLGGGPRFTLRNSSRVEPWMHVLIGLEHFRFAQTEAFGSQNSLAFLGGIGADYKFRPRIYVRVQGDYLGTHFQPKAGGQSNFSIGSSVVFNF